MNGFKILAIRPLKDCRKQFLKNLNAGEIYKFYQDYDFIIEEKKDRVIEIQNRGNIPDSLYGENINISAIVGKNGSGKSSIVEIFSTFIFCLSKQLDLININNFKEHHRLNNDNQKRLDNELENFKSFECEVYFLANNNIYCLTKNRFGFEQITFENTNKRKKIFTTSLEQILKISEIKSELDKIKFLRESFFYSILANYSLYGLNTNETGIWLRSIFHKNDGYQTPIVLNPMRTEGKIDINRLTDLSKSRLLGNVFMKLEDGQKEKDSLRSLVNDKIVNKLLLKLDYRKFIVVGEDSLKPRQNAGYILDLGEKSIYLEYTEKYKKTHFYLIIEAFYPNKDLKDLQFSNSKIKKIAIEYILKKAFDIISKYPQFSGFKNKIFRANHKKETVKNGFKSLSGDFTHSTFKLRQALNFLVHDFYRFKNETEKKFLLSTALNDGITDIINHKVNYFLNKELEDNKRLWNNEPDISDIEQNNKDSYNRQNLINYLPPSFFEIDFEFKEKGFFKDLSSGEKQMIYSINSIIYHINNLNSIYSLDSENRVSYRYINIILDEIELYFHPEFQRVYINELIKSINFIKSKDYKFNIIFLTHSPFILSDIPTSNILRLQDGNIENVEEETYAGNVHDLLANDFFLENGFMGEFAKQKIKDLLKYLTYDEGLNETESNEKPKLFWSQKLAEKFIKIIGEPLLRFDLKELYLSKFYNEEDIDNEIERLKELKKNKGKYDIN